MPAQGFRNLVKKQGGFSPEETRGFFLSVIILAVIFSWDKWGTADFDVFVGIFNLIAAFVIASIAVFVHHFAQRLWGLRKGLKITHQVCWWGAGISLLLVVLSKGNLTVLAITGTYVASLPIHRLGQPKQHPNISEWASIAMIGPAANVVLAGIIKSLQLASGIPSVFVDDFVAFNIMFAVWNLLPVPPLDGSRVVYSSIKLYAFAVAAVIAYVFLSQKFGLYAWLWSIIIGAGVWTTYYLAVDRPWQ